MNDKVDATYTSASKASAIASISDLSATIPASTTTGKGLCHGVATLVAHSTADRTYTTADHTYRAAGTFATIRDCSICLTAMLAG